MLFMHESRMLTPLLPLAGGTDHNLLDTNQDIGNVGTDYYQKTVVEDTSEPNYSLQAAEAEVTPHCQTLINSDSHFRHTRARTSSDLCAR